jgi:hypothetical protein
MVAGERNDDHDALRARKTSPLFCTANRLPHRASSASTTQADESAARKKPSRW